MSKKLKAFQANFDAKADAYENYYRKPANIFQNGKRHRLDILRDYVKALRPMSILDIGCGPGVVLNELVKTSNSRTAFGIDFSWPMLCQANQVNTLKASFSQATAEHLPFSEGIFDFACALGVIGYVSSPKLFIREVQSVLRPGGVFAFTCPNGDSIPRKLRDLMNRHRNKHPMFWAESIDSRNVRRWLMKNGFELVKCHFIIYGNGIFHFPWSIPLSNILESTIVGTRLARYLAWSGLWIVKKI